MIMRLTTLTLATCFASLTAFAAAQRPGSVDLSFECADLGGDQIELTYHSLIKVADIAVLPDGRIYIGGHLRAVGEHPSDAVARLLPDGSVDPSFQIQSENCATLYCDTHRIAVQPDGKVLAGFYSLKRFLPDGSVDPEFKAFEGMVVGLRRNGNILAVRLDDGSLVELLPTGAPNPDFRSTVKLGGRWGVANLIGDQLYAPIEIGDREARVIRVNASGATDASFRSPSLSAGVQDGSMAVVRAIQVDAERRVLVAGVFDSLRTSAGQTVRRRHLVRLLEDGTLDPGFNPAPVFGDGVDYYQNSIWGMALQPDGKILVGGVFTGTGSIARTGIVRLRLDGSLDSTFDAGLGVQGDCLTPPCSNVKRIALQPDGRILISGSFHSVDGIARDWIARLNGDGSALRFQKLLPQPDGSMHFNVSGPSDAKFVLEAASRLSPPNWQPLSTNTITTNPLTVTDPDAAEFPQRFYRAVSR